MCVSLQVVLDIDTHKYDRHNGIVDKVAYHGSQLEMHQCNIIFVQRKVLYSLSSCSDLNLIFTILFNDSLFHTSCS